MSNKELLLEYWKKVLVELRKMMDLQKYLDKNKSLTQIVRELENKIKILEG